MESPDASMCGISREAHRGRGLWEIEADSQGWPGDALKMPLGLLHIGKMLHAWSIQHSPETVIGSPFKKRTP